MVIVISSGRSGTNLALEIISASPYIVASDPEEDKYVMHRSTYYPDNLLTKTDTHYIVDKDGLTGYEVFVKFMRSNTTTKLIWTIRHPYDWAMSKIYRGWGGADDATFNGCLEDMRWCYSLFNVATTEFKDRVCVVKMEDILSDIKTQAEKMCSFLELPFEESMLYPWKRMRNPNKKERYPDKLYKNQIDMYLDWKTLYDGFFVTKVDFSMEDLFYQLDPLLNSYDYKDKRVSA